jgi:hypothetical protein
MIVSTWQFLQKKVRCGSLGRVAKGVKLAAAPAFCQSKCEKENFARVQLKRTLT